MVKWFYFYFLLLKATKDRTIHQDGPPVDNTCAIEQDIKICKLFFTDWRSESHSKFDRGCQPCTQDGYCKHEVRPTPQTFSAVLECTGLIYI